MLKKTDNGLKIAKLLIAFFFFMFGFIDFCTRFAFVYNNTIKGKERLRFGFQEVRYFFYIRLCVCGYDRDVCSAVFWVFWSKNNRFLSLKEYVSFYAKGSSF